MPVWSSEYSCEGGTHRQRLTAVLSGSRFPHVQATSQKRLHTGLFSFTSEKPLTPGSTMSDNSNGTPELRPA